jgi:formylglycine-generating enzyme required for sulfatase activity
MGQEARGVATPANSDWPFDAKEAVRRQEEAARTLGVPKELKLALSDRVWLKLILIPAGRFMMGGGRQGRGQGSATHEVTISKSFYMGIYDVTQEQYEAIMGENPSRWKEPTIPVDTTTVQNEEGFCQKASQVTGRAVRLPTSEEWEYACRAGTATRFYWGDDPREVDDYDWYIGNSDYQAHPVGLKKPNHWGLYDMLGNVWVRCKDPSTKSGYVWRSGGPWDPISLLSSGIICGEKGPLMGCGLRVAVDVSEAIKH